MNLMTGLMTAVTTGMRADMSNKTTVLHLKNWLSKAPDHARVCIDTEARTFNAHLYDCKNGFFEGKEMTGEDLFILSPDYSNTYTVDVESLQSELTKYKKALEVARHSNNNLIFHIQDYALDEESFVLIMEFEKARQAEQQIREILEEKEQ